MPDIAETISQYYRNPPRYSMKVKLNLAAKRTLDIVVSAAGLVLGAPIMAAQAIAIYVDSGKPIIFKQERVGYRGKKITVRKFRTMHHGTERRAINNELETVTEYGDIPYYSPVFTRIGRYLDCTHINELPQLWSVLKGEMSLVGNRPQPLYTVERCIAKGGYKDRFNSKPGLLGYVQLYNRKLSGLDKIIGMEKRYSDECNNGHVFMADIKILANSFKMYAREIFTRGYFKAISQKANAA